MTITNVGFIMFTGRNCGRRLGAQPIYWNFGLESNRFLAILRDVITTGVY